jgi:bifunctional non-homologous end joining protein LigD
LVAELPTHLFLMTPCDPGDRNKVSGRMPSSCNHSSAANVGGNTPRTKGQLGRLLLNTKWLPYTRGNLVPDQNKLSKYWAKQDFTTITEPSGRRKILPSVRRRFVIQKHAATRLHYDLGLELDDVFKSWGRDQGTIAGSGGAGRGSPARLRRFRRNNSRRGIWRGHRAAMGPRLSAARLKERRCSKVWQRAASGSRWRGERLRGNWVLVRMKPVRTERKRVNWLLIKRRDEHSRDADGFAVLVEDRSIAPGRTMAAIADGKGRGPKPFILAERAAADPGAVWDSGTGVAAAQPAVTKSAAGSNRARPASVKSSLTLPDFIPPRLCVNMERPPNGPGWAHEIKFDGYRVQLRVQDGTVTLKTCKGLDWTAKFGTPWQRRSPMKFV